VKHAAANRVTLRLDYDDSAIWLEINDNGRGFDAQSSFPAIWD
jgi:signal transduction histidine kinase